MFEESDVGIAKVDGKSRKIQMWQHARYGMQLMLTDHPIKGMRVFKRHHKNVIMEYGLTVCKFLEATLNLDVVRLNNCVLRLEEMLTACKEHLTTELSYPEWYETRIILADCLVFMGLIHFQREGCYFDYKAWRLIRNALHMYEKITSELAIVNKEIIDPGVEHEQEHADANTPRHSTLTRKTFKLKPIYFISKSTPAEGLDRVTCIRLMRGAAFGNGLIQLNISMMSPNTIKLAKFLRIKWNRDDGLAKLNYCKNGTDLRSLLAVVVLLWYHTVARSVFYLDGQRPQVCIPIATKIIKAYESQLGTSSLFMYFQGRIEKLKGNIPAAIDFFSKAADRSNWRELNVLVLHELGFCYMIELRYWDAQTVFMDILRVSRWSRCFYAYCLLINSAADYAAPDVEDFGSIQALYEHDTFNPRLEEIVTTRRHIITTATMEEMVPRFWRLLIYEILYLHHALPLCTESNLSCIIDDCTLVSPILQLEPFAGLSNLIAGSACHLVKDDPNAFANFKECLARRHDSNDGSKTSVHALSELGRMINRESPLTIESVHYLNRSDIIKLRNWRFGLRSCPPYKIVNANAQAMMYQIYLCGIIFALFMIIPFLIPSQAWESGYDYTYPITPANHTGDIVSYRFGLVADLNVKATQTENEKLFWQSYIRRGELHYNGFTNEIEVTWDDSGDVVITSKWSFKKLGFELSDMIVFNGKLYAFDEQTGIIFTVTKDNDMNPWVILMGGDGTSPIPLRSKWAATIGETLYVGSHGREYNKDNQQKKHDDMYIKKLTKDGSITHVNWVSEYTRIKSGMGLENGLVSHEAVAWSNIHLRWYFLPRRCSSEPYDKATFIGIGCSKLVTSDENVVDARVVDIETDNSAKGFSSFRFLPGSDDTIIVAVRTLRSNNDDTVSSYLTAFDIDGKILLKDLKFSDVKYEGFEFI